VGTAQSDPGRAVRPAPTRVFGQARRLDYEATRAFFEGRATRASGEAVLTSVLYQDSNPALARQRDETERDMVLPWLPLHRSPRVLDIGCGIGRWGIHLAPWASAYQGIDFSPGLVEIARAALREHYPQDRLAVDVLSATELSASHLTIAPPFDVVIQAGLLVYLNDDDLAGTLGAILPVVAERAVLYLREPVAAAERLTLDRHWSEELKQEYSASYRPAAFYQDLIDRILGPHGFAVTRSVALDTALANRRETTQHFFLVER
jgi:SAM-dependent methyltransferase